MFEVVHQFDVCRCRGKFTHRAKQQKKKRMFDDWRMLIFGYFVLYHTEKKSIKTTNINLKKKERTKKVAPNVGLEPTTLRLRVSCSTD